MEAPPTDTCTGDGLDVPPKLPQRHSVPSLRSANDAKLVAAMPTTSVMGTVCGAVRRAPPVSTPSCPSELPPQVRTVPSASSAIECCSPADTWRTDSRPGISRAAPVPVTGPSAPELSGPNPHTVPFSRNARVWLYRVEIARTWVSPFTSSGSGIAPAAPTAAPTRSPSPHARTVPFCSNATEYQPPAATDRTSVPSEPTGRGVVSVLPSERPSAPALLTPQLHSSPSERIIRVWVPPPATIVSACQGAITVTGTVVLVDVEDVEDVEDVDVLVDVLDDVLDDVLEVGEAESPDSNL
jgi:hypothetical protein